MQKGLTIFQIGNTIEEKMRKIMKMKNVIVDKEINKKGNKEC